MLICMYAARHLHVGLFLTHGSVSHAVGLELLHQIDSLGRLLVRGNTRIVTLGAPART